jgi:tRNA pseudouridine38-40 synthase
LRYFIEFSYNGKNYFGYQIQPNAISVQEELEKALSTILEKRLRQRSGKNGYRRSCEENFCHFDTEKILDQELVRRLNSFLPADISIKRIFPVKDDFHARFDATYRTYEYYISLEKIRLRKNRRGSTGENLWMSKMNEACKILFEYEDFTSFAKLHTDNKTNFCKMYKQNGNRMEVN